MKKESVIQQEIVAYLSSIAQQYNFVFFAIPNEGFMVAAMYGMEKKKRYAMKTHFKKMGLTPGMPDLCLLHEGRAYMFEVKRPGEKLTNAQENIHELLNDKINVPSFVVNSVDDVKNILEDLVIFPGWA